MIAGREKEQQLLTDILGTHQAEFLVIYGRRRIGKTFLVETFFEERKCCFFHVTGIQKGKLSEHLDEFSKEIGRVFYGGAKIESPETWMKAFEALYDAIRFSKNDLPIVIFLDEFPWLSTPKSRLLQALEYYWNRFWKNDHRVKLILCGSSASWMVKKIINNKGGLHNRLTHKLNLQPFNLTDTRAFLESKGIKLSAQKLLDIYFVLGGVPYYLSKIQKSLSVAQNINKLCFHRDGVLFDEFNKIFSSLFKESEAYEELMRIISKSRQGVGRDQIEKKARRTKKGGTLTSRLEDLEMAGFIKGFLPVGHSKRGMFYRISDEYTYFYLQWIEPERHNIDLENENNNFWLDIINTSKYQSWRGYVFESLCYKHIGSLKKALGINHSAMAGAWQYTPKKMSKEKGAQIDLLFDRIDDAVTICEIKYSDKAYTITKEYAEKLQARLEIFKNITRTKKQLFLAFIVSSGVKKNKYSDELLANVVTLDDLFKEV